MRVKYKELMEKLGVGHELSAYETRPWFYYDDEKQLTCSAEVRVGPGSSDVEAEIQFLHDEEDDEDSDGGFGGIRSPEQIMLMRFLPSKDQIWTSTFMTVKGKDYVNEIHNWGERGCSFFYAIVSALQMDELIDIDELIEKELTDSSTGGRGRRGRVGKKGFKVEQKPMGMGIKP